MSLTTGTGDRSATGGSDRPSVARDSKPPALSQPIGQGDQHHFSGNSPTFSAAHDSVAKNFDQRSDGSAHPFTVADNSKTPAAKPGAAPKDAAKAPKLPESGVTSPGIGTEMFTKSPKPGNKDAPKETAPSPAPAREKPIWEQEGRPATSDEIVKALAPKK